jgi:mannose-6-phosphate isomerase-like protein (cupin superfamily)
LGWLTFTVVQAQLILAGRRHRRSVVKSTRSDRMADLNRQAIATDWALRGFSCELWTDPPGQCWEDFAHATDELVIVLEGEMEFEIAGEVRHPKVGEEVLIPGGAVHSARNIGSSTARWLYGYNGR